MKFFLDTADLTEIRKYAAMGLLDGVTTNPSLIAKTGKTREELIPEICEVVGAKEGTIKSRMRYALESLRQQLSDYEDYARTLP